jgi:hypothetical protein
MITWHLPQFRVLIGKRTCAVPCQGSVGMLFRIGLLGELPAPFVSLGGSREIKITDLV